MGSKAEADRGDVAIVSRAPARPETMPQPLEELSLATLARDVEADGRRVPAGSTGTIVYVYRDGVAYEVEFFEPFHCVTMVESDAIER